MREGYGMKELMLIQIKSFKNTLKRN